MSNNDKFIRDTEFGKLMESSDELCCTKCKYERDKSCMIKTNYTCDEEFGAYFAKEETEEETTNG